MPKIEEFTNTSNQVIDNVSVSAEDRKAVLELYRSMTEKTKNWYTNCSVRRMVEFARVAKAP